MKNGVEQEAGSGRPMDSWLLIMLIVAFGAAATAVVPQAVPVLRFVTAAYPDSASNVGWLVSLPSAICALGALPAGLLVDRIGDRRMLLGGSVFVVIGDFGVYFASSFQDILVWRLIEGLGYLALTVGGATMLMRIAVGARRKAAMAIWSAHTPIGFALALMLITPFASNQLHWRWAFAGHGLVVAGLAIVGFFALNVHTASTYSRGAGTGLVLKSFPVYRLGIASLLSALLQTGFMTALPSGLMARFDITQGFATTIAIVSLFFNMTAALGLAPALKRGLSPKLLSYGGVTLVIGSWVTYFLNDSFAIAAAASALFCFALGGVNASIWAQLPNVTPNPSASGASSGLVTQATYMGVLVGPPIVFGFMHGATYVLALAVGPVAALLLLVALPSRSGADTPHN